MKWVVAKNKHLKREWSSSGTIENYPEKDWYVYVVDASDRNHAEILGHKKHRKVMRKNK